MTKESILLSLDLHQRHLFLVDDLRSHGLSVRWATTFDHGLLIDGGAGLAFRGRIDVASWRHWFSVAGLATIVAKVEMLLTADVAEMK